MIPDIFIDDEFKSLIPPLAPEEYAQLEANILAEGCRDALVLWDDVLIDGHNRYGICQKHGIPFKTVQSASVQSYDDAVLWIVNNQLGRRNITDFVRGELALRAKPIIEARAKAKQIAPLKQGDSPVRPISDERAIRTDDAIAAQAGVGRDTLRKIEKIQESAAPEVLTAVRAGAISINAAGLVARLPAEQQSTIAAAGPAEIKKAAAEVRKAEVKPQKAPEPTEADTLREALAEMRETASMLAEELEAYRAVEAGSQFEEIKRLQERNRILKSQLDDYITQNQQLKKQVRMLERRAGGQNA
jgi:hypothetical protein